MVFFTCQYCNANLKRKDIPVHKFKCNRSLWLTCIDCLKDFKNDEYEAHLQCITEDQKYGGKNYVAKETGRKQNSWMGAVQKVIQSGHSDRQLSELFAKLEPYNNIPRQQKKFQNFVKNSFGSHFSVNLFNKAYELFAKEFAKVSEDSTKKKEDDSSGEKENDGKPVKRKNREDDEEVDEAASPPKSKKKKRNSEAVGDVSLGESEKSASSAVESGEAVDRHDEDEGKLSKKMRKQKKKLEKYQAELKEIQDYQAIDVEENDVEPPRKKKKEKKGVKEGTEVIAEPVVEQETEDVDQGEIPTGKFDWGAVIREVLTQASGKELSLKKLGKKVLSEYWRLSELNASGTHEKDPNKLQARFNKKLGKTQGVKVCKDRAKLVE